MLVNDGIAVAKFGGDLHLARDPGDALDEMLSDHPGIGGSAAGGDGDLLDVAGYFRGKMQFWQGDAPVL